MNNIFFRIYAGVLIAILLIGGLAYGSVQLINGHRADTYRESMARGTFHLMAQSLQMQASDQEKEARRQLLSRLMGTEILLQDAVALALESEEGARLEQGRVVMRLDKKQSQAEIIYQIPGEDRFIVAEMEKVSEQHARATAMLVLDALSHHPREEWDSVLGSLQKYFGYPINRKPLARLNLDQEQLARLDRREIVLALDEGATRAKSVIYVYAPIVGTADVLVLGPMSLFDWMPLQMSMLVGILGLLAMGLATYLLVRPLQTRLRSLDAVVRQISSGNLDVRANVGSRDAIGQLAATFNGMTAHIRRLIESQREMTRAVSHELRTPVARLRFGMEILADCEDASERQQKLEALDRDIEQLDLLIDEILTFARLEEGTPSVAFSPVRIPEMLLGLRDELMPLSGGIHIRIDAGWEALSPTEQVADGEERYLHRIMQNLVTNALRYARSTVVMVYRVEGRMAVLEVQDDGPGIDLADREHIFKPFARLDKSRHRASGGYGLGLSIVKRIAEWHGGRVEIDDSPLGGALFRVSWPRIHTLGQHVLGDMLR